MLLLMSGVGAISICICIDTVMFSHPHFRCLWPHIPFKKWILAHTTTPIVHYYYIINIITGHTIVALLTVALAGACFGFLPYNHSPARIFLGDSGSLTIGLVLACIGIESFFQDPRHAASPLISVPIFLFCLPVFDTCRVMYKRWRRGVSIFQADKGHVHHRLLELGFNHREASWLLYGVVIFSGMFAIILVMVGTHRQLPFTLVFCMLSAVAGFVWQRWARNQDSN